MATGTYGLSFGALAVAAGLSLPQLCALSSLMFTGASQFAMVGVVAAGGNPFAGAATAALLGSRNALYGLHLAPLLHVAGWRRPVAAHLVIDESTAMTVGRPPGPAKLGFWTAGLAVFACWNLATLAGALGTRLLSDPRVLGLDVVAPAAFLALLAPRMVTGQAWVVALLSGIVALLAVPILPAGVPVLVVAVVTALFGVMIARRASDPELVDHSQRGVL
ncbi:AzlC family ABC transporter permease [Nocardia sp. CDC160]|uniref:AzlC family ABC transporter permease n=1 Tax=Nocardia sp. CDC160 TaxID=3112166 RepID=UPI002DBC8A10|nr:AzlC family ABC transporter permease [Nocardia sp. CDC160]MEC3917283.1 AzlC family ABC transporter permease [Nocardia sp. CDC160]